MKLYKLTKIKSINDESKFISVGSTSIGHFTKIPKVGRRFEFFTDYFGLYTSEVVEIIDEYNFRTRNSIYSLMSVKDERNMKIENIIK